MESIIALLLDEVKYFNCTVFRSENMKWTGIAQIEK